MNSPISKSYLLSWIKSLTLADHLGDVWDDVDVLLKYLGEDIESDDIEDLQQKLTDRGVLYLHEDLDEPYDS
jgi:hypothetical protein